MLEGASGHVSETYANMGHCNTFTSRGLYVYAHAGDQHMTLPPLFIVNACAKGVLFLLNVGARGNVAYVAWHKEH
jgi:hypothetical protein